MGDLAFLHVDQLPAADGAVGADRLDDVLGLQLEAALGNGEIEPDELREIVIFLTHYAGWPAGAKMNSQVEVLIDKAAKAKAKANEGSTG